MIGLLPDHEIRRLAEALVEPFDPARVQPASYDLTAYHEVLVPHRTPRSMDLRDVDPREHMTATSLRGGYELRPGGCLLASTAEIVRCPDDVAARVEGKSSLGRLFLAVHVTAGWIDPGWNGRITLEIVNHGPWAINLRAGMPIAQVNFTRMGSACTIPYGSAALGSHYQGHDGPRAAAGVRGR